MMLMRRASRQLRWSSGPSARRFLVDSAKKRVLITTPIYYVNAKPHIGHVHSSVLADALARWHRMQMQDVLFTTGTDEHGLKVQEAAEKAGTTDYKRFCDQVSSSFRQVFEDSNVKFDRFIRTSDQDHHQAVHHLWRKLKDDGYIYLGKHESWYCKSDESFLTDMQVKESTDARGNVVMVSLESGHPVERLSEENYKFRLSAFEKPLLQWLDANPDVIVPASRLKHIRSMIESGLRDVSVSRLRSKIEWAIQVPNDDAHCIYVWLDALTNYLTCSGYPNNFNSTWPADYHIVGKDILKFHAIYWPAFLIAAGLPLPKKIVAHSHWTVNHVKMSKSLGNVVNPNDVISKYGADSVRYFLLREGVLNNDGDFSTKELENCVNSELADTLGNLVSRSTGKAMLLDGKMPVMGKLNEEEQSLVERADKMVKEVTRLFGVPDFAAGLKEIVFFLHEVNRYFTVNEPWKLAKELRKSSDTSSEEYLDKKCRLDTLLNISIQSCRVSAILLQPVIPEASSRILDFLQVPSQERLLAHAVIHVGPPPAQPIPVDTSRRFIAFRKF